jgi:amino acid transporter
MTASQPVTGNTNERSLVRALGVWGLAASIVNVTVGGGIFRLPAAAASALGPAAPLAYLLCAVAMALIVICFAEAGSRVSLTGGLYAYVEVAFGPLVGFLVGVMLWAGIALATSAITSFFGDALGALIPPLAGGAARIVTLGVILLGFGALNISGVRTANRFNAAMTVAKLLPLALLLIVGAFAVRTENLHWTNTPGTGEVARASAVLIFAFLGVESALVPSGEVFDPARTVPQAILVAMVGITALYLAVQLVAQGILGPDLAQQKTPLAEAAAVAMGTPGRMLILIGSIVSMFGYIGAMILAGPRMLFALGRDGFLPPHVARVHPRYRTPHVAIALHVVAVFVLSATGTFEKLGIIANGSILLVYAACCLAVIELRRRHIQTDRPPFQPPFGILIPILAFAAIAWILSSLTAGEWKAVGIVFVVAVVLYVATTPSRRAARSVSAAETTA